MTQDIIEYRGFKIEKDLEPWAIKFNMFYKYYRDEENIYRASTIEDAKAGIDEYVSNEEYLDRLRKI